MLPPLEKLKLKKNYATNKYSSRFYKTWIGCPSPTLLISKTQLPKLQDSAIGSRYQYNKNELRKEGTLDAIKGEFPDREETLEVGRGEKRIRPVQLTTHLFGATTDPYNCAAAAAAIGFARFAEREK